MKPLRFTLVSLLGVVAFSAAHASSNDKDQAALRVEVVFTEPEKFSDAADGQRGSDMGRDAILSDLQHYIARRAGAQLAEGQRLTVTVTDVDLAGEIEPWHNPSASHVRIVKDIYFPRIDLNYRLTYAGGAVVKEGKNQLRDMNFQMNINPTRSEPRVHEYALIDNWVRQELGRAKKKK